MIAAKIAAVLSAIVAQLTAHAGIVAPTVHCFPTMGDYYAETRVPPGGMYWPGGVAGAYGWLTTASTIDTGPGIALTPQTCADLAALATSGYTWQRGFAAFVLGHEITHAIDGPDEHQADCGGIQRAPAVMYLLGVRDRHAYAELARELPRDTGAICP